MQFNINTRCVSDVHKYITFQCNNCNALIELNEENAPGLSFFESAIHYQKHVHRIHSCSSPKIKKALQYLLWGNSGVWFTNTQIRAHLLKIGITLSAEEVDKNMTNILLEYACDGYIILHKNTRGHYCCKTKD